MDPTPLAPALASLWRSVYKKAAALAEARAGDLLRDHVYLFHRTAGVDAYTKDEADERFVNVPGDTMTGPLEIALETVTGGPDAHVYGPTTPAPAWASVVNAGHEVGLSFRHTTGGALTKVRWYRATTLQVAPAAVRLWDTTSTASPVWTTSGAELAPLADTVVGWKEAPLSVATRPSLVANRFYVLSLTTTVSPATYHPIVSPVPEAPLDFGTHRTSVPTGSGGGYPANTDISYGYGLDAVVEGAGGTTTVTYPVAQSGALRLQNASPIAWRDVGDTADLTLTMDGSDRLALGVGAGAVTTSATAGTASAPPATPAVYLTVVVNGLPRKIALFDP